MFMKLALTEFSPAEVAWMRIVMGSVVLCSTLMITRGPSLNLKTYWRHYLVLGLTTQALPFTLIASGQQHIASATTAIIHGSVPMITAVLVFFFIPEERLDRRRLLGLGFGLGGLLMLIYPSLRAEGLSGNAFGMLLIIAAMLSYSFSVVFTRRFMGPVPAMALAAAQSLSAAGWITALALLWAPPWQLAWPGVSAGVSILYLGLVSTGLAYVLFFYLIANAGAVNFTTVLYLTPCVGTLLGVVVLGEDLQANSILALATVLTGVYLATSVKH